jgi:hypothetical protein
MIQSLWKWFLSSLKYTLFVQEENALHHPSKLLGLIMVSNPHWFGPPTDTPYRHRRKEEEDPYLHTRDNKSKDWATTLNKTYPLWLKDHELDM